MPPGRAGGWLASSGRGKGNPAVACRRRSEGGRIGVLVNRTGRRQACIAAWLALTVALPGTAAAQTLPGSVDPGRLQQRLHPPSPPPAPEPPLGVPQLPESLPPEQAEQIRFPLRQVVVEGATAYSAAQLRPLYAGLLDRVVSLAAIYQIADAITRQYRSDGYILSRAVVL